MDDNHKSKLTKWLELLQQESWQLELIISGFAIFLVASLYESLTDFGVSTQITVMGTDSPGISLVIHGILMGAWFFLLINLIFHVVIRGFWIAAIGLRYISGEIDFDELRFSEKFDTWLRQKIIPYDEYIERLEKLCSVVFAFTFLLLFMFVALGLFLITQVFIVFLFQSFLQAQFDMSGKTAKGVFLIIYNFLGFIYFLDFVTLGKIKRIRWFSRFYFPIYRFFSFITISFLYRPLYYNLIDNQYGRRLGYLLVPYVFIMVIISSVESKTHLWFPLDRDDQGQTMSHSYYDDLRAGDDVIMKASIPSKYVKNNFLELFITYNARKHDQRLASFCPDFEPFREAGYHSAAIIADMDDFRESAADTAIYCFNLLHDIYINDSLYQGLKYYFYTHPKNKELGLLTVMDVAQLGRGQHDLKIDLKSKGENSDTIQISNLVDFPFWKE